MTKPFSNILSQSFIAISILIALSVSAHGQSKKKVLFLGNSYTGVNNLPNMISLAALSVGDTLLSDSNTPGGYKLSDHHGNSTSINKILQEKWDYVVLQDQSQEPSWQFWQLQTELFPYAEALCDTIRHESPCSKPMFFMTWGRENGDSYNCPYLPLRLHL